MGPIIWLLISIAALVILIAVVFIVLLLKKKIPHREPDYQMWFWLGLCWIGAGVPLGISNNNYALFAIGLVFMIFGLAHKKEWKKNKVRWEDLTPIEKKFRYWIFIILGILVLAGLVAFLMIR